MALLAIGGDPIAPAYGGMYLGLPPAPAVHRLVISPGKRGTAETVAIMACLAMGEWGAKSERIRALAIAIVRAAGVAGKDYRAEIEAIHTWVQRTIRYTRDPVGQETVQTPGAHRVRAPGRRLR